MMQIPVVVLRLMSRTELKADEMVLKRPDPGTVHFEDKRPLQRGRLVGVSG